MPGFCPACAFLLGHRGKRPCRTPLFAAWGPAPPAQGKGEAKGQALGLMEGSSPIFRAFGLCRPGDTPPLHQPLTFAPPGFANGQVCMRALQTKP